MVLSDSAKRKITKVEQRKKVLGEFTMQSDLNDVPITNEVLPWHYFNPDYYSHDREYEDISEICEDNLDKMIDVRPYLIETPFLAQSTDKLQKILDVFRTMHLRSLPVTNPGSGALEGIITRQDIFAYMSL